MSRHFGLFPEKGVVLGTEEFWQEGYVLISEVLPAGATDARFWADLL
jgi:hypothetical protein